MNKDISPKTASPATEDETVDAEKACEFLNVSLPDLFCMIALGLIHPSRNTRQPLFSTTELKRVLRIRKAERHE